MRIVCCLRHEGNVDLTGKPRDLRCPLEPTEELRNLNSARHLGRKPPVGFIEERSDVFGEYGASLNNPVVVNGMAGLVNYLKTLRFKKSTSPTTGTLEYSVMQGDYPVDCLRVSDGTHEQKLFFCLYGGHCDTKYPDGFCAGAVEGESSQVIKTRYAVPLRGDPGGIRTYGHCIFGSEDDPSMPRVIDGGYGTHISLLPAAIELDSLADSAPMLAHIRPYAKATEPGRGRFELEPNWTCWFSGKRAAAGCELLIPMFSRFGSAQHRQRFVVIPRSGEAKRVHDGNKFRLRRVAIGGLLGGLGCLFFSANVWPGIFAGALVGLVYALATRARRPEGWRKFRAWKRFPDVQQLLAEGWTTKKPA
jgi:hypothetical protein